MNEDDCLICPDSPLAYHAINDIRKAIATGQKGIEVRAIARVEQNDEEEEYYYSHIEVATRAQVRAMLVDDEGTFQPAEDWVEEYERIAGGGQ